MLMSVFNVLVENFIDIFIFKFIFNYFSYSSMFYFFLSILMYVFA